MAKAQEVAMLSQTEKLAIIDQAIEAAEEQDIDFDLVFTNLMNAFVESIRKDREEATSYDGSFEDIPEDIPVDTMDGYEPQEQEIPDIPEDTMEDYEPQEQEIPDIPEDIEDENDITQKNNAQLRSTLTEYFRGKIEKIKEVTKDGYDFVRYGRLVELAKKGAIVDYSKCFGVGGGDDPDMVGFIEELNSASREFYYDNLMLATDEELMDMKESVIMDYIDLADKGLDTMDFLDTEDRFHPERDVWDRNSHPTLGFDGNMLGSRIVDGRHTVGFEKLDDPLAFDEVYGYAKEEFSKDAPRHNKDMFTRALDFVRSKIDELQEMTAEQFRAFKIGQMTMSSEEKERYDNNRENLRTYGLSKDEDDFAESYNFDAGVHK